MNYNKIHQFVDSRRNVFWDGWTAVLVERRGDGFLRPDGIFYRGAWGVQRKVRPDSNGIWKVPARYV